MNDIVNYFLYDIFERKNIFSETKKEVKELTNCFNINAYYLEKNNKIIISTEKQASSTLSSIMQVESSTWKIVNGEKSLGALEKWKFYSSNVVYPFNRILWNPVEETFTYPSLENMNRYNSWAKSHERDVLSSSIVDYILHQHRVVSNHISKLIKFKQANIEIIFIYRNPIKHIYSSIIEDYCKNFEKFDSHKQLELKGEERKEFFNTLKLFSIDTGLNRINLNTPRADKWSDEFIDTLIQTGIKNFILDHTDRPKLYNGFIDNISSYNMGTPKKKFNNSFILSNPGHFGHGFYYDFLEKVHEKYKDTNNIKFFNMDTSNIRNVIEDTTLHNKSEKWSQSELNKTPKSFFDRFENNMNLLRSENTILNTLLGYKLQYPIKVYNKIKNNE